MSQIIQHLESGTVLGVIDESEPPDVAKLIAATPGSSLRDADTVIGQDGLTYWLVRTEPLPVLTAASQSQADAVLTAALTKVEAAGLTAEEKKALGIDDGKAAAAEVAQSQTQNVTSATSMTVA